MISALATLLLAGAAGEIPELREVTVYPDRARVTRQHFVSCAPAVTVEFSGLPPAADVGSLRAAVVGGELRGLSTVERAREKTFSAALQQLIDQVRQLEAKRAEAADSLAGLEDSTRLTDAYLKTAAAGIGRELDAPPRSLATWQHALLDPLQREIEAEKEAVAQRTALRELDRQLAELRTKAEQLRLAGARKERVAQVLVSCVPGESARTMRVNLSYLVGGASWSPAYAARANPDADQVELTTYATVRQATGEDWRGVRLTLSTALPLANATPPEIAPLHIAAFEREPPKKVLVARAEQAEHAEATKEDSARRPGSAARDQGLSVQLEVPAAADVTGDGTPVRLLVGRTALAAHFAERTAPAVSPFVYRVADVVDEAAYPLLAGPVELFWKGGFIGRQPLQRVAAGARFHLSFGLDEQLKVERETLEEVKRDSGLFGKAHRLRYGYRDKLMNFAPKPRQVELQEALPVSEVDDVAVAVDETTSPGFETNAQDGRLTWKVPLQPGQSQGVEVHFHVDVPSDYDVGAL